MREEDDEQNQEDADSFIANCGEITMALKKCVDAHPEYYGKMSQPENQSEEEKTAEEEAAESAAEDVAVPEQPAEQPVEKEEVVVESEVIVEQPASEETKEE